MKVSLPLFKTNVEIVVVIFGLIFIFTCNMFIKYFDYVEFKSHNWATVRGEVANIVPLISKNNREYKRLYVKSDAGFTLSIAYWAKDEININSRVGFRVKTEDITFKSFVSRKFYAPSVLVWHKKQEQKKLKTKLIDFIKHQHESTIAQELYSTLYFATPISKELRDSVQRWGIAHLIAISGYHLGLIFGFLYALFLPIYRFFHKKYFPYRNLRWDISVVIFTILGFYLLLIDMTPSFLRSYAMGVFGFLLFSRGISVLNIEVLLLTSALLIAVFPHLLFSIGFLLSISGVFFIFVFLKHFKNLKFWQTILLLNFWLFIAMNPIVYFWFGVINIQQITSVFLSILFIIFYPATTLLHVVGFGGIFDKFIIDFLLYETRSILFNTPIWMLGVYIIFSILSYFNKFFMLGIAIIGVSYFLFFI